MSRRRARSTPSPPPADTGTHRGGPGRRSTSRAIAPPGPGHDAPPNDSHGAAVTATKAPTEPPSTQRSRPAAGRPHLRRQRQGLRHLHPARPRRGRGLPHQRGDPGPHRPGGGHPRRRGSRRLRRPADPRAPCSAPSSRCWSPRRSPSASPCTSPTTPRVASRPPLGYVIDLLAAIPSVVYGFWGLAVLAPALVPFHEWAADNLSFIPFFAGPAVDERPHDVHRRPGAGGHDPADHLGHLPRGVQPGPGAAPRRRRSRSARPAGR